MSHELEDGAHGPLPREWLPDAGPAEGTPEWEALVARVVDAVALPGRGGPAWPSVLGSWWRPAAGLPAAAAALLLLLDPAPTRPAPGDGALPLSVVAGGGEPSAVLEGLGIPAHPVLALITLQGGAP
jgi:hypothetical protein